MRVVFQDARPDKVVDLTFDLMVELGADDEQLDFPILKAIARDGVAWRDGEEPDGSLAPLFEAIVDHVPAAAGDTSAPFLLQVANLDYSDFLGRLAVGRVRQGRLEVGKTLRRFALDGSETQARVTKIYTHLGLERIETAFADAGDIVALAGLDEVRIGETLSAPGSGQALPFVKVDEPTVSVTIGPNTSPLAGREGRYVTSRHLGDRLERELLSNVALRVEDLPGESFRVSGRGELHLSVLLEQMRREGYEMSVSRPEVITKTIDGVLHEPFETVVADVPEDAMGAVMESLASRKGTLVDMAQGEHRARLEYRIPARGLFGFRTTFLSQTQGEGLLNSTFEGYGPHVGEIRTRRGGSLVSMETGEAFAYSIWKLQDRGEFFIEPGTEVYVGMIVGANNRPGDLDVNVTKNKKLTNVRSAGSDDNLVLIPPRKMGLEDALEYLEQDELLEITPSNLRLRKRTLDPNLRKREAKAAATAPA